MIDSVNILTTKNINSPSDVTEKEVDDLNVLAMQQFEAQSVHAMGTATKALVAAKHIAYLKGEAGALLQLGLCYSRTHDYSAALNSYHQALSNYELLPDEDGVSTACSKIGNVYLHEGKYREALEQYDRALPIKTALNDIKSVADLRTNSAIIHGLLGNHVLALELHLEAVKIFEQLGDQPRIASSTSNIGLIYWEQQSFDEALKMFYRALEIRQIRNDIAGVSDLMNNIGNVYCEQKKFDSALEIYNEALLLRVSTGNDLKIGSSCLNIGNVYIKLNQYKDALEYLQKAHKLLDKVENKRGFVQVLISLGDLYLRLEQYDKADEKLVLAVQLAKDLELKAQQKEALGYLTNLFEKEGNFEKAFTTYRNFIQLEKELINVQTGRQIAQLNLQHRIEQKAKETQIEHLKNVQLKEAMEKLQLEKSRSEHLFQNQIQELKLNALQAQMNPHFVFNSLNSIQHYIWEKNPEDATAYLSRFSILIRAVLDNSRKQFVTLEEDLSALRHYIELESIRFENKFEYQIICEPGIHQASVELPPMIIQPFVENAILHGLQPLKTAGKLTITIKRKTGTILHITIEDNGVGRAKASQIKLGTGKSHQSVAMQLTRERLEKMEGGALNDDAIVISDVYDKNKQPAGTRVEINMPVE